MEAKNKLINVDLTFVIEQLDDNNFVCNSLPDRQILIRKKGIMYAYTTTFHASGYSFDYETECINYANRPRFTTLEKIQHDLSSCFFNYVGEEYPRKTFEGVTNQKSCAFGFTRDGDFCHINLYGRWLFPSGTHIIEESYIYDNLNDELYQKYYGIPKRFKDIFDMKRFTNSYFSFYESMSTDGLIVEIAHFIYATKQDVIIHCRNDSVSISDNKGADITFFTGAETVRDELKKILAKVISQHPTDYLKQSCHEFNIQQEHLTIEDLQTIMMADI